jgi:hypothetical protein
MMNRNDEARAKVKAAFGAAYDVVNIGGYWVIGETTNGWARVSPEPLRRSIDKAIADVRRDKVAGYVR